MKNEPLISVVIPAHNAVKYIHETIQSVLNQTYKNFEIIVVDDGSTDATVDIVMKMMEADSRILCYKISFAGRPSIPRNYGIWQAKGEYVAFLDSDDIWSPYKLEYQINYVNNNSELIMVYTMSLTFGEVNIFSSHYELLPLLFKASRSYQDLIGKGNSVTCSSVLIRTDLLKEEGGFDEDPNLQIEDYDLWLRLSRHGNIGFIPRILVYYRVHSNQYSSSWEVKVQRLAYLSKKRNIILPEYKFYRNKNILLLLMRNILHVATVIYVKAAELIERNKKKTFS
ncbi:MAG: glycosyltransferase family A protein [Ignavibacteria bacterium]